MPARMYDAVLVPTDGSPTANAAVRHAIDLARRHDASLHALYVVDVGEAPLGIDEEDLWATVVQGIREEGQDYTGSIVEAAREEGLKTHQAIEEHDSPAEGALAYAEEHGIEAIVVGTHGRSGPQRWLLGSVSERIVRGSRVPVLVVPPEDGAEG